MCGGVWDVAAAAYAGWAPSPLVLTVDTYIRAFSFIILFGVMYWLVWYGLAVGTVLYISPPFSRSPSPGRIYFESGGKSVDFLRACGVGWTLLVIITIIYGWCSCCACAEVMRVWCDVIYDYAYMAYVAMGGHGLFCSPNGG